MSAFKIRDILVPLGDSWDSQSIIYVVGDENYPKYLRALGGHGEDDAPEFSHVPEPDPVSVFIKPVQGTIERESFDSIVNLTRSSLNAAPGGKSVEELLNHLVAKSAQPNSFVERVLRLLVARGSLLASGRGKNGTIVLRLSERDRVIERRVSYSASFAEDLAIQAKRIGDLVGHGPTVGSYREELLRTLLQNHIPRRFHAATGFVDGCPNQFDILIYDQIEYSPIFRAGDLVVVRPAAVRAVIEVKSNLTAKNLKEALKQLDPLRINSRRGPPIFTGVFAYKGASVDTLATTVRAFYRQVGELDDIDDLSKLNPLFDVGESVDAICVMRKSIFISNFTHVNLKVSGKSFSPQLMALKSEADRPLQAALFFNCLSRYLRYPFEGSQVDLEPVFGSDVMINQSYLIYDDNCWGLNRPGFPGGHFV